MWNLLQMGNLRLHRTDIRENMLSSYNEKISGKFVHIMAQHPLQSFCYYMAIGIYSGCSAEDSQAGH